MNYYGDGTVEQDLLDSARVEQKARELSDADMILALVKVLEYFALEAASK